MLLFPATARAVDDESHFAHSFSRSSTLDWTNKSVQIYGVLIVFAVPMQLYQVASKLNQCITHSEEFHFAQLLSDEIRISTFTSIMLLADA